MARLLRRIGGIKKHVGWLLAELFIVFVSVYAAATLASYREQQRAEQRTQQIEAALLEELERLSNDAAQQLPQLEGFVASWEGAYNQGQTPQLIVLNPSAVGFDTGIWTAMLQSGGVELLDVKLILDMQRFYRDALAFFNLIEKYDQLMRNVLIPQAGQELSEFYDMETKQLRAKYAWYIDIPKEIAYKGHEITKQMNELISRFRKNNP